MTEACLRQVMRFGMGFHKSWDNRANPAAATVILSSDAFGFAGNGGSIGFAAPDEGLSFGYVMNRMNTSEPFGRAQRLIDLVYQTLGYRSNSTGNWTR
jgi:CubicO group peptidase (beta-lactamase class C family)